MAEEEKVVEEPTEAAEGGGLGERVRSAAVRYLGLVGYEVLETGWTCPAGEIDVIARDGDAVVFVEVKARTSIMRGFPSDVACEERRSRLEKIAAWYLRDYEFVDVPVRFDAVALLVVSEDRALVQHHCNVPLGAW